MITYINRTILKDSNGFTTEKEYYEFYYALRKLLIGAMLEYEISRLA